MIHPLRCVRSSHPLSRTLSVSLGPVIRTIQRPTRLCHLKHASLWPNIINVSTAACRGLIAVGPRPILSLLTGHWPLSDIKLSILYPSPTVSWCRLWFTCAMELPIQIHQRETSTQCEYGSGNCLLKDGSMLIWSPNKQETCRFEPLMKMCNPAAEHCGSQLILSDQGYALAPSNTDSSFLVASNQLAAQLQLWKHPSVQRTKTLNTLLEKYKAYADEINPTGDDRTQYDEYSTAVNLIAGGIKIIKSSRDSL
ncbi:hypothetical protein COOONC_01442 [Cooperia oncophora]